MKTAPTGWHLPTDEEWQKLVDFAGGDKVADKKLRAKDGWDGNGTDDFGFSALPGGNRNSRGGFNLVGECGLWWCSTERDNKCAYNWGMFRGKDEVPKLYSYKAGSFSVRLVQETRV